MGEARREKVGKTSEPNLGYGVGMKDKKDILNTHLYKTVKNNYFNILLRTKYNLPALLFSLRWKTRACIERFPFRGQHLYELLRKKRVLTPTGLVWNTNMAAVTSCECAL